MDSRLTRGLNKDEADAVSVWFRASKLHLDSLVSVLEGEIDASLTKGDGLDVFDGVSDPLPRLAHAAGYREGLRHAVRLLAVRKTT